MRELLARHDKLARWAEYTALLHTILVRRRQLCWPPANLIGAVYLLFVWPFAPNQELLRPLLTSRSGSALSPFQAQSKISPGKNAFLHRTTAAFTPLRLDHESFTVSCPLALPGSAFYAVLGKRSVNPPLAPRGPIG